MHVQCGATGCDGARASSAESELADIFGGVDAPSLVALARHSQMADYHGGQTIYAPGAGAGDMYVILGGAVKLVREVTDRAMVLTLLGRSELFGGLSVLDHTPRGTAAHAATDVRVARIDAQAFRTLARKYPPLADAFLQRLARRVRRAHQELSDVVFLDGPGRLARRILQLARWLGTPEGEALRVNHNLTQREIAELNGSSREMVSKWLAEFADRGWIKVERLSMVIYNRERLAARALESSQWP